MFKKWVIGFVAYLLLLYYWFEVGTFSYLWDADVSKLSFAILSLFTVEFVNFGLVLKEYDRDGIIVNLEITKGYDISVLLEKIGMMGTIIGFIVMLSSLKGVDLNDMKNVGELFNLATKGMSTALFTTLAGLVTSTIIENLYKRLEDAAVEEGAIVKIK
jgi:hypothetical protein